MKILGIEVRSPFVKAADTTYSVPSSDWFGGWIGWVQDWCAGAWQRNLPPVRRENVIAFSAVYACVNRIANDIAKMPINLMRETESGVLDPAIGNTPYRAVIVKPNSYQTRVQFIQQWIISKLLAGNTYILKVRDARGIVIALYVLPPRYVTPLVTEDGSVYYQIGKDQLSEVYEPMIVPASEIIHDMMPALFHPLCGTTPIYACGMAATQGVVMQKNQMRFFNNMSRPSGVLTAPGSISKPTADRVKAAFEENYSGENFGRIAVLGDGLKWEPMTLSAADAQLIEQLKWSAETVCSCFDVPPYKIGMGTPGGGTIEGLNNQYYTQCLQPHVVSMELLLREGLNLSSAGFCASFDTDSLLRMDTAVRFKTWGEGIKAGFVHPNWARKKEQMQPVEGGDTPYMQQQNYPLAALAQQVPPSALPKPAPAPAEPAEDDDEEDEDITEENIEENFDEIVTKRMAA